MDRGSRNARLSRQVIRVELDKPTVVTRSRGRPLKHRDYVSPVSDDPDRPWANLPQPAAMKTMTVRLPMEMYQELKWYGETTYGASMNDIVDPSTDRRTGQTQTGHESAPLIAQVTDSSRCKAATLMSATF